MIHQNLPKSPPNNAKYDIDLPYKYKDVQSTFFPMRDTSTPARMIDEDKASGNNTESLQFYKGTVYDAQKQKRGSFTRLAMIPKMSSRIHTLHRFYPTERVVLKTKNAYESYQKKAYTTAIGTTIISWFAIFQFARRGRVLPVLRQYGRFFGTHRVFRHYVYTAVLPISLAYYYSNVVFTAHVNHLWQIHARRLNNGILHDSMGSVIPGTPSFKVNIYKSVIPQALNIEQNARSQLSLVQLGDDRLDGVDKKEFTVDVQGGDQEKGQDQEAEEDADAEKTDGTQDAGETEEADESNETQKVEPQGAGETEEDGQPKESGQPEEQSDQVKKTEQKQNEEQPKDQPEEAEETVKPTEVLGTSYIPHSEQEETSSPEAQQESETGPIPKLESGDLQRQSLRQKTELNSSPVTNYKKDQSPKPELPKGRKEVATVDTNSTSGDSSKQTTRNSPKIKISELDLDTLDIDNINIDDLDLSQLGLDNLSFEEAEYIRDQRQN